MQQFAPISELVRISDLTQDLTVGLGPALASVRTLTNVSLSVHAQELVVLSGTRGAGERALLAVIAGDRRGVTGTCDVSISTRVRLMRIQAPAALALTQEWARAAQIPVSDIPGDNGHASELFLLDVEPAVAPYDISRRTARTQSARPWSEDNRSALLAWAALCRARGGAVVLAAGQALGEGLVSRAMSHSRMQGIDFASRATSSHSTQSKDKAAVAPRAQKAALVFERHVPTATVRIVVMHCGRVAPPVTLDVHDLVE